MAVKKIKHPPVCTTCKHFILPQHNCKNCGVCRRECVCRKRAGIGDLHIPKAKDAAIGNSSMFVHSRRAIGLELEFSSFGTWLVREKDKGRIKNGPAYTIDHDGSVKPSGLEAVIEPLAGDQQIINGLNAIANQVWDTNCEVNETCGYHVHVDARDFSWHDIQKLLIIWMKMEAGANLWRLAGRNSTPFSEKWITWWKNITNKPINLNIKKFKAQIIMALYNVNTLNYKEHLQQVAKSDAYLQRVNEIKQYNKRFPDEKHPLPKVVDYLIDLKEHKRLKSNRGWNRAVKSRYLDLNIHSWLFRGTVEYRLGAGTVDPNDIRMWPLWCLWFTELVSRTSLKIIMRECGKAGDIIDLIIKYRGFPIPTINGEKIYPISHYLLDWLITKTK